MRVPVPILCLVAQALSAAATAAAADLPDTAAVALARKVQAFYERTHDFEASFTQTYTYLATGQKQTSSGQLRVKKPGKLAGITPRRRPRWSS